MNANHVACWKEMQEIGCYTESQKVSLIKASLLRPSQQQYLNQHRLSIEDLLNGRYPIAIESEIHQTIYKIWNDVLEVNGLRREFSEDLIGEAMTKSIEKLGMPFTFG